MIEDAFEALAERENLHAIQAELDHADAQLARGEYTEYHENTIGDLVGRVRTRGMQRLAEERQSETR